MDATLGDGVLGGGRPWLYTTTKLTDCAISCGWKWPCSRLW